MSDEVENPIVRYDGLDTLMIFYSGKEYSYKWVEEKWVPQFTTTTSSDTRLVSDIEKLRSQEFAYVGGPADKERRYITLLERCLVTLKGKSV